MQLDGFFNFNKKITLRESLLDIGSVKITSGDDNDETLDIDSINDRLGQGDRTALDELNARKISYTIAESDNGYTIKYSYNGTKYTITYYASNGTTPENENGNVQNEPTTDTTAAESNSQTVFDYTSANVNKDAKVSDLVDRKNPSPGKAILSEVDSGAYDDVFKELEKMKPQLLAYIKEQMEAGGYTYNAETAEKYLNIFITQAVKLSSGNASLNIGLNNSSGAFSSSVDIPENPTIEDLVNYIRGCIDFEMEGDSERKAMYERFGWTYEHTPFSDMNKYDNLTRTADYLLTDEEKDMKEVLAVLSDSYSENCQQDRVLELLDVYQKYLKDLLQSQYPTLEATVLEGIIKTTRNTFALPSYAKRGTLYSVDDTFAAFEKKCRHRIDVFMMTN